MRTIMNDFILYLYTIKYIRKRHCNKSYIFNFVNNVSQLELLINLSLVYKYDYLSIILE